MSYEGKLIEEIEETPRVKTEKFYVFEETTAKVEFYYKTFFMRETDTIWDYLGPGYAVKERIETAKAYCKKMGVTKDSELEIVVVKMTQRVKKKKTGKKIEWGPGKGQDEYESMGHVGDTVEERVWSSKKDLEQDSAC